MARAARIDFEGAIHHITARGDKRRPLFADDHDRRQFLDRYARIAQRRAWVPLSYCLMGNHLHLAFETPECTLSDGMRDLAGGYARWFNTSREVDGHVFQGRFHSRPVLTDAYLAQLLRYVARNPVIAGLCPAEADWRWSGHRALMAGPPDRLANRSRVEELLAVWGAPDGARYAALFDASCPVALCYGDANPWDWRRPLEEVFANVSQDDGIRAARDAGHRLADIAAFLGVHESTISRRLRRACKKSV